MDEMISAWMDRYAWGRALPTAWRQITHRLVRELGAERFATMPDLHSALSTQNEVLMWDALDDRLISRQTMEFVDMLLRGAPYAR